MCRILAGFAMLFQGHKEFREYLDSRRAGEEEDTACSTSFRGVQAVSIL